MVMGVRAEINDGQRADADVSTETDDEAAGLCDSVGNDRGADLVHLHATVGFGNVDAGDAQFAGFLQEFAGERKILLLDAIGVGHDLFKRELFGRRGDLLVFFGEIFGRKDVVEVTLFEQKTSAGDALRRNR